MGVKEFKILFDNPMKTYVPGEIVSGRIVLDLDSPKKCRGLKIKITGEAKTHWKRGKTHIQGREEYFSAKYYLVGGESDELELDPGEHIFLFEYVLPAELPSSFELKLLCTEGCIRYTVKAIIDRPWKFDNETKVAFTVLNKYDLNTDPGASGPIMVQEIKTFGVFTETPPLTITLFSPVRGYVSGQSIPVKVNIENDSGVEINDVKLKIEKYVKYLRIPSSDSVERKDSTTVVKVHKGKMDGNVINFDHVFEVPPLSPSNLGNCGIITNRYTLELEAYVDRMFSRNLKICTPILIGTVPLVNYQSLVGRFLDSNSGQFLPSAPLLSTPSPSAPPDYFTVVNLPKGDFDLPPPTYQKSIFAAESLQDEDDSDHVIGIRKQFAPRYPFYNFSAPQ